MRRLHVLTLSLLLCACATSRTSSSAPEPPAGHQAATPHSDAASLWNELLAGNRVFVAGTEHFDHLRTERAAVEDHQSPVVTVLTCSDSRVPPELLFDRSLGKLFVIRIAGNVADTFAVASLEYAVLHHYATVLVVLGHENCGAVSAALDDHAAPTAALSGLLERIRSSFAGIDGGTDDPETVWRAVEANTRASAASLTSISPVIGDAVRRGEVVVIPAVYSLKTGEVRKLE